MREAANVLERRPHAIPAPVEERRAGRVNEIRIRKYCPTCFASGRDQVNGGVMARDQLRDQHSLDLVARLYANNSGERRLCLTPPLIEIVGLTPQNKGDLINEEVGEIGTVGAADRLTSSRRTPTLPFGANVGSKLRTNRSPKTAEIVVRRAASQNVRSPHRLR